MTCDAGRAICAALTAIMTGVSYATSAEMAAKLGAFPGYREEPRAHAARDAQPSPRGLRRDAPATSSVGTAAGADRSRRLARCKPRLLPRMPSAPGTARSRSAKQHGYRNAQATVIAPTGTIGLVMDCDTTGIEPDFALVKFKKLAGGGYFKIINRAVPEALRTLGYSEAEIAEIEAYAVGHGTLAQAPGINHTTLEGQGLHERSHQPRREGPADRLRHQVRVQQVDARRGILPLGARRFAGRYRLADLRSARASRLHQARDRGRQHPCLRRDDGRRRAAPEARALSRVRLRQPVRAHRQALSLGREPHPHDGGGAALHLGRHLQDHQHAERGDRRGLQIRLPALLEARAQGQRALSRRLEAQPAAAKPAHRRRGG